MRLLNAVQAPPHWRTVDFISDLHLQAAEPATFDAWRTYLENTVCDALFILGDLFEVWVGDDVLDAPEAVSAFPLACVQALAAATQRFPVYFMCGNRDFLAGQTLLTRTGMQGLADPAVLTLGAERWLLSHGDALCLADTDYLRFRKEVRSSEWQAQFLAQPLAQRLAVARQLRQNSDKRKGTQTVWADVDTTAACELLAHCHAHHVVHGHTHQPASHMLTGGALRHVLSDWDAESQPPRLQVFRWWSEQDTIPSHHQRICTKSASTA